MSGRDQDQGGQGGKPGQGQGGQGQQQYVVKTSFTDDQGKQWQVGSVFKGDENAIRKAIAAGQIAERPDAEPKT